MSYLLRPVAVFSEFTLFFFFLDRKKLVEYKPLTVPCLLFLPSPISRASLREDQCLKVMIAQEDLCAVLIKNLPSIHFTSWPELSLVWFFYSRPVNLESRQPNLSLTLHWVNRPLSLKFLLP